MNANELKRLATRADGRRGATDARSRFVDAAVIAGAVDVAVGAVESPVGRLYVAVTPKGVARVAFADEDRDDVLAELAERLSPRILESERATAAIRRELEQYFDGRRTRFDVPVDRRLIRGIARDVLGATSKIPFGRTSTYRDIAERIGRPRAARAVGNALGSNPIPIVIPCHRVL
ncbi:MAG TPA: methylated-DNA--[protein]-cysteine S-methyltransferase, partial [Actinomycetota bacterium]|nr:methylated-DNA--[protein]-cysteine S-methyltransferase [Actinomycetota bacterium]